MDEKEKNKLKKIFGVNDLRNITGEMIFNNSKKLLKNQELAQQMWENIGNFSKTMSDSITCIKEYINKIIDSNNESAEVVYKSCLSLIAHLDNELKQDNTTKERRDYLYKLWFDVIKEMQKQDRLNKFFWLKVTGVVATIIAVFSVGYKMLDDVNKGENLLEDNEIGD